MYKYTCIYIYIYRERERDIYIYTYIGGLGELVRLVRPQNREIDSNSDFDLCVGGKAKLCGRLRERCFLDAGAVGGKLCRTSGLVAEGVGATVAAIHVGFN